MPHAITGPKWKVWNKGDAALAEQLRHLYSSIDRSWFRERDLSLAKGTRSGGTYDSSFYFFFSSLFFAAMKKCLGFDVQ